MPLLTPPIVAAEADPHLPALEDFLESRLLAHDAPLIRRFTAHLLRGHGREVAAILFYGSCLFPQIRTASSFHDFYLLTDSLRRYHRSSRHALLNLVLPPNVYYRRFSDPPATAVEQPLRCKVCVLSLAQFQRETSSRAHDLHHLGRFSKRFALIYSRDQNTTRQVVAGARQALLTLVPHTLALLPPRFSLEAFALQLLGLSYLGEKRVAEPEKVSRLFQAGREHYLELFPRLLALHARLHGTPAPAGSGEYTQPTPSAAAQARTRGFLRWSRARGVLRWPKYMLTVDNWLEYIQDKLARHQGIDLELTERERRFPLIFGWPRYFELRRRGIVG